MLSDNGWPEEKGRNGLPVWRLNRILGMIQTRIQKLSEDERELPIVWNVMHMYGTIQLAKLLALKRGLNPELAALTCAFHDVYTLLTGKTADHGVKAESFINEIIIEYNLKIRGILPVITDEERTRLIQAVKEHSDKNSYTRNPLIEFLKDIDSLDSYLQGMTQGKKTGRIPRVNKIFEELGIDHIVEK